MNTKKGCDVDGKTLKTVFGSRETGNFDENSK